MLEFEFTGELFQWQGGSWHFVELDPDLADEVNRFARGMKGGWGSVRVTVRIGATEWHTSLFPSRQNGTYLLPVKRDVRRAEGLEPGDELLVVMRLGD